MDSSKAKTILIFVFILLNIFLMVNVVLYARGDGISRQTLAYTAEFLKSRGVELDCSIPATARYLDLMEYSSPINENKVYSGFMKNGQAQAISKVSVNGSRTLEFLDQGGFVVTDKTPGINTNDEKSLQKYAEKLLKQLGVTTERMVRDYSCSNSKGELTVRLTEKYKGCYIFNNYIEAASIGNRGISVTCHFGNFTGSKGNNIIPAYQVLMKNFSASGAGTIKDIDFGFMVYKVDQDTKGLYDKPVWRIKMSDGTERYFKAFEGSNAEEIVLDKSK